MSSFSFPNAIPAGLSGSSGVPTAARGVGSERVRTRWGVLEWFLILQTLIPGILFVPGMGQGIWRVGSRAAVFGLALGIWAWTLFGKRARGAPPNRFSARVWLGWGLLWMFASIFHPTTNCLRAGIAAVALTAAVAAPAFWAGEFVDSGRRLRRLALIFLACQGLHAGLGVLQVRSPEVFLPPSLRNPSPSEAKELIAKAYAYVGDGGRLVVRPCGLTDSPGAASAAGAAAALTGLALAVSPGRTSMLVRLVGLGVAGVGTLAMAYTMVRAALVMQGVCLLTLLGLFLKQGRTRQAAALLAIGGGIVAGAGAWLLASGEGRAILDRFSTLFTGDVAKVYQSNRGVFLAHTFNTMIWDFPLGGGLGRWGMVHVYFGDPQAISGGGAYWIEIQWSAWVLDGGFPLLIAFGGAMFAAMWDTWRVATRRGGDPEVTYWASVVFAMNLSVVALTFSYVPFVSPIGMNFWLLAGTASAAERASRLARRSSQTRFELAPILEAPAAIPLVIETGGGVGSGDKSSSGAGA